MLIKPDNVPTPIWNDLNKGQKLWVIEHERLHEVLRYKMAAAKAAIESVYTELSE